MFLRPTTLLVALASFTIAACNNDAGPFPLSEVGGSETGDGCLADCAPEPGVDGGLGTPDGAVDFGIGTIDTGGGFGTEDTGNFGGAGGVDAGF